MLVAVEADTVAETVGEKSVVRAEARRSDDAACGIVDGAGKFAGTRGVESSVLRFADSCKGTLHFFRGLAEDAGARHVGAVAFYQTAVVDQNDIAFFKFLRFARSVRERRRSAEQNHGIATKFHFRVAAHDHAADVLFGQSLLQILKNQAVDVASGFAGQANELEFVR